MHSLLQPTLLCSNGRFERNMCVEVAADGTIASVRRAHAGERATPLHGKALLPGFVNAHSHTFQRLIRGRSESRATNGDDFWSWRQAMYRAAEAISPDDLYDVSRMAFLEMALAGTTTVGEFHYLHRQPDSSPYPDGNLLAKKVIAAAQSVGIRIALLRVGYFRAGFDLPPNPGQSRFIETLDEYLRNTAALHAEFASSETWVGAAPHSIRAASMHQIESIAEFARTNKLPLHLHAAEQQGELEACRAEYQTTPVALLADHGVLSPSATLVHAIHVTDQEFISVGQSGASVCACPTTERNLGDGIFAADRAIPRDVNICFGSDSQTLISPLEDARELDYHLRLIHEKRVVLDGLGGIGLAQRLFGCATSAGARSLASNSGEIAAGKSADFFAVDLAHATIAGCTDADLLGAIVFSAAPSAVRDVFVAGRQVVHDGAHPASAEIIERYQRVAQKVWNQ
jgi:formimidoylglutamate deiminase